MGKQKVKRFHGHRGSPVELKSASMAGRRRSGSIKEELTATLVSNTISRLIEKLQSPCEAERECACCTLTNLISQHEAILHLMKANIVKILGPLMLDPCTSVRHAAVGALRNLSVDGRTEVCEDMVKQDIMTPVIALLEEYGTNWSPDPPGQNKLGHNIRLEIFNHAIHLLWNVCEMSDIAVSAINVQLLLPILIPCLNAQVYGYDIAIATGQCLYTLTDNNPTAAGVINLPENLTVLLHIVKSEQGSRQQLLLKTLVAGIIYNTCQLVSTSGTVIASIVEMLAMVLQEETLTPLIQIRETISQLPEVKSDFTGEETTQVKNQDVEIQVGQVRDLLTAQQIALEIIANLCCSDGSEDGEWEDISVESFGEGSSEDEVMEEDRMLVDESQPGSETSDLAQDINASFSANHIFVLSKIIMPDPEIVDALNSNPKTAEVMSCLKLVQSRALLSINNLIMFDEEAFGSLEHLNNIWLSLSQLVISQNVKSDSELLEAVTAAMRSVAHKLSLLDSMKLCNVTREDLQYLFAMGQQCDSPNIRANAVRIISSIACSIVKRSPTHDLLKEIGLFYYSIAKDDCELWVCAEALDALFDCFTLDETDPVLTDITLLEKLKALVPCLKSKVQQQKGKLGEHQAIISMAKNNLMRFIKYKQKRF